jgi:hypothetical protein
MRRRSLAAAGVLGVAVAGCTVGVGGFSSGGEGAQPSTGASVSRAKSVAIFGAPGLQDGSAWLGFLRDYPLAVTRIDMISSHLNDRTLAAFDIVILDRLSRNFDADEASALEAWVRGGGSVMSMTGYVNGNEDVDRANSLLAKLPILYLPGLLEHQSFAQVSTFTPHPTTTGLGHLPFFGGYRVELVGTCDGPSHVVATIDSTPVGVACQHGAGRVYVWGDEWVEYSSQWAPSADAPKFWKNVMDWLTHQTS